LVVAAAAEALGKIGGKQALSELSKMLNDADLSKRKMAAVAFKHMRGKDVAAELLARLSKESDTNVKADVVIALGEVGQDLGSGPETKLVVDELIKILNNSKTVALKWLISNTIQALGKLKDKRATKDLLKAIDDWRSDESILIHGINALGLIGDTEAVDYLDTWLRLSTNSSVRLAAADALGKIGGKIATSELQK